LINPLIYAEIAPAFASQSNLDQWLDPTLFHELLCRLKQAGWQQKPSSSTAGVTVHAHPHCPTSISEHMLSSVD